MSIRAHEITAKPYRAGMIGLGRLGTVVGHGRVGASVLALALLGACAAGGGPAPVESRVEAPVSPAVANRPEEPRHGPILAWARAHSAWADASRARREQELTRRLADRRIHVRSMGNVRVHYSETFARARSRLSDVDLLTLLVLDEVIHQPSVVQELRREAEMDRRDPTAEYGGLLDERGATLYPPHAGERPGDFAFVASTTMMKESAGALAHYHFHAQAEENAELAGPSAGDLDYAKRFGQHCIVFTSVGRGRLDADVYFPDGVVVDLGEVGE